MWGGKGKIQGLMIQMEERKTLAAILPHIMRSACAIRAAEFLTAPFRTGDVRPCRMTFIMEKHPPLHSQFRRCMLRFQLQSYVDLYP